MNANLALVIVTDVDACLVDRETYSHEAAADALEALRRSDVPLVLCSSKTRAELIALQQTLGIAHPFISENGGAVDVPVGYYPFEIPGAVRHGAYDTIALGRPYQHVVEVLRRAAEEAGVPVVGFNDMSVEEVSADCGLPLSLARLAKERSYDEPFRVVGARAGARDRLHLALQLAGLFPTAGGRYDHATGGTDKGKATRLVGRLFGRLLGDVLIAGLGDGLNDVPMLCSVDIPVVVRSASASATARVLKGVPGARVTRGLGPAGWRDAVLRIVRERGRSLGRGGATAGRNARTWRSCVPRPSSEADA